MTRAALALLACLVLAGCSSASEPVSPSPEPSVVVPAPEGGRFLSEMGFRYAPAGVSIPADAVVAEKIDQHNNVTLVLTSPTGVELAAYLRSSLVDQGFEITADDNNSLLFERGQWQGAFTTEAGYSALSFRTDRETGS